MVTRGLSERRALTVVRMSAAALRYVPRPDADPRLRDRIVALAHRRRRYGAGMIYLKLRQEGRVVKHKGAIGAARRRVCRSGAGAARRCRWPIVSRWYGHRRTVPGNALTPSGSRMFCSIHADNATRGGGTSERRALRRMVAMVVMRR